MSSSVFFLFSFFLDSLSFVAWSSRIPFAAAYFEFDFSLVHFFSSPITCIRWFLRVGSLACFFYRISIILFLFF